MHPFVVLGLFAATGAAVYGLAKAAGLYGGYGGDDDDERLVIEWPAPDLWAPGQVRQIQVRVPGENYFFLVEPTLPVRVLVQAGPGVTELRRAKVGCKDCKILDENKTDVLFELAKWANETRSDFVFRRGWSAKLEARDDITGQWREVRVYLLEPDS